MERYNQDLLSGSRRIVDLDDAGVKVDSQGRISDWHDRPAHFGRPIQPLPTQAHIRARKKKVYFLPQEEELVQAWFGAAVRQGVLKGGKAVFEQLECLAYESKWRIGQFSRPPPVFRNDAPFPRLRESDQTDAEGAGTPSAVVPADTVPQITEHVAILDLDDSSYNDFRVDKHSNVLRRLGLADDTAFFDLLTQPWFLQPYLELSPSLQAGRDHASAVLQATGVLPRFNRNRAPHRFKLNLALSQRARFLADDPDKALWSEDEHDVRFMVRFAAGASRESESFWGSALGEDELCHSSLWLVMWLRWLYRPTKGQSADMQRLHRIKLEWLDLLDASLPLLSAATPVVQALSGDSAVTQPVLYPSLEDLAEVEEKRETEEEGELKGLEDVEEVEEVEELEEVEEIEATDVAPLRRKVGRVSFLPTSGSPSRWSTRQLRPQPDSESSPVVDKRTSTTKFSPPVYTLPRSQGKRQQKGLFWLTEDCLVAWQNRRDSLLAAWGVTAKHSGTCVLVAHDWGNMDPLEMLDHVPWNLKIKEEEARLRIHIGDMQVGWARAAAWFKDWARQPRRGVDLDQFLSTSNGVYVEMHGSHLCHHGLCVLPEHIHYENNRMNSSRNQCAIGAREARVNGTPVPSSCQRHDPPCRLQHAALTTYEAVQIQLWVLREAHNIPQPTNPPPAPADHPPWYDSFEFRLPTQEVLPTVQVDPSELVRGGASSLAPQRRLDPFNVRCRFCHDVKRNWHTVTSYWSHVKVLHGEIPQTERLREVTVTARLYLRWLEVRSLNYERDHPATWNKLRQAVSSSFDWNVFSSWRLPQDRAYERVRDGRDDLQPAPYATDFPTIEEEDEEEEDDKDKDEGESEIS